jgi:Outer membrane protein beta-barrel domain
MNIRTIYIRQTILLLLLLIFAHSFVFSQGTNISRDEKPGLFIGLSMMPSQSQILNEGDISGSKPVSDKMISYSGLFEFGYFFSKYFGFSSGMGLNSYKSQLSLSSYQDKFNATDSENESYERRVTGTGIKEIQNISSISIPLCINFRLPFNQKAGFFIHTGINMSVPLIKTYNSSGTFSYKGYYAVDNVVLENLPDYGFPSNVSSKTEGKLELKSFGIDAVASAGLDYFVNEKLEIEVSGCYNKSLSNISGYSSPANFSLTSDPSQINSLMGGSMKTTASSIGIRIGIRYYLK